MSKFPSYYDEEKRECMECGCLLPPDPDFVKAHAKDAAHIIHKLERENAIKQEPKQEVVMEERAIATKDMTKELAESMSLGDVFVKSGMFPDLKSQAQAVVKILAGRELGLSPLQSVTDVYIVNGKLATSAKIIASLIKKSGKYDYHIEKLDNEECVISFFQLNGKMEKIGECSFTKQDAISAGLINKQSWKSYPKDMLFARTISAGGKRFCPDVITAYTPEELEEIKPKDVTAKKEE